MAPSLVVATQLISHTLPLLINASQEKRPPTSSYVVYVMGLGPFPEKGSECLAGGQGGSGHEKRENLWPRWALGPSCSNSPRGERPHPGCSTEPGRSPVPQATGTEVAPWALESGPPGTAPAPPTVPDRAAQLGTEAACRVLGQQRRARERRGRSQGRPRHCPPSGEGPLPTAAAAALPALDPPRMLPRRPEPPDSQKTPSQQQGYFQQGCPGKGLGPPLPLT